MDSCHLLGHCLWLKLNLTVCQCSIAVIIAVLLLVMHFVVDNVEGFVHTKIMSNQQKHLSIRQAAEWLGLSPDTVYHWVIPDRKAGRPAKLPSLKFGKRVLIAVSDLEAFAEANRRPAI